MKTIFFINRILLIAIVSTSLVSCRKFLDIPPPKTALTSGTVFNDDKTAIAAQDGVLMIISGSNYDKFHYVPNLSSDEWLNYDSDPMRVQISKNKLTAENSRTKNIWSGSYSAINQANALLEGLMASTRVNDAVKKQLMAEAKFCRAFQYFYLVNFFGDVPLVLSTAYQENVSIGRTPSNSVYDQIVTDLLDAQRDLSDTYLSGDARTTGTDRLRPSKLVATALLARVYLYRKDWSRAEAEATKIISNPQFILEPNLDNVFLTNSKEAIWQLPSNKAGLNTWEGLNYNFIAVPPAYEALNPNFINVFEANDLRRQKWVGVSSAGAYYPYKYKVRQSATITEYETVIRLAEIYLIRAEARAQLDNLTGTESAKSDLDKVRSRSGLNGTSAVDKSEMLSAILRERQVELFAEFGHRWLDLKRTGTIDQAMQAIASDKQTTWDPRQALYPVPASEILLNKNLLPNNPGY